jgi:integrase
MAARCDTRLLRRRCRRRNKLPGGTGRRDPPRTIPGRPSVSENHRYNGVSRVASLYTSATVRQYPCFGHGYRCGVGAIADIHRLREKQVLNAKPDQGRRSILLADGANLYLQATVGRDGSVNRSWVFRYEFDGERHDLGLGPLHTIGLADARERARQYRQQIIAGVDPLSARREVERERLRAKAARAKAVTFKECSEAYLKVHANKWRNARHAAQWDTTLKVYAFPILGDLAVADIDTGHVQRTLEPIWQRIPETARRLRGRIEAILTYATAAKFRTGHNPASWDILQHLLGGKKKVAHLPALPFVEAPAFFAELRNKDSATCRALQFTILTAARTAEALGAQWIEIDLQAKIWLIPPERMKAHREHRVPLSAGAAALLKTLPRRGPFAFHAPGRYGKPLDDKAMLDVLYRMRPGITVHGFRSTFRDWAAERTNFPREVVEMALAHVVGNKVEAAYRRGDLFEKRRRLMEAWAGFLSKPVEAVTGAAVIHVGAIARAPRT